MFLYRQVRRGIVLTNSFLSIFASDRLRYDRNSARGRGPHWKVPDPHETIVLGCNDADEPPRFGEISPSKTVIDFIVA